MSINPHCFGKYRSPQHDAESGCLDCTLDDECSLKNRLNRLADTRAKELDREYDAAAPGHRLGGKDILLLVAVIIATTLLWVGIAYGVASLGERLGGWL